MNEITKKTMTRRGRPWPVFSLGLPRWFTGMCVCVQTTFLVRVLFFFLFSNNGYSFIACSLKMLIDSYSVVNKVNAPTVQLYNTLSNNEIKTSPNERRSPKGRFQQRIHNLSKWTEVAFVLDIDNF